MNGESCMETYTLPYVKQIASGHSLCDSGNSNQGSVTTLRGGMEVQEGGDICVLTADSHFCMAETNTTLKSNYPAIKNNYFLTPIQYTNAYIWNLERW